MNRWVGRLHLIVAWEPPGEWGDGVLGWRVAPLRMDHVRQVNVRLGVLHLAAKLYRPGPIYRWLAWQARGREEGADGDR